jgi:hypothetical protein
MQALICHQIDPLNAITMTPTSFFNKLGVENCFPGGVAPSEHPV